MSLFSHTRARLCAPGHRAPSFPCMSLTCLHAGGRRRRRWQLLAAPPAMSPVRGIWSTRFSVFFRNLLCMVLVCHL